MPSPHETSPPVPASTRSHVRFSIVDANLPDLTLPAPVLAIDETGSLLTDQDKRSFAMSQQLANASPNRFHSASSGRLPNTNIPLRPILHHQRCPKPPRPEQDIAEVVIQRDFAELSPEPAFAPRDDDEPHPEHGGPSRADRVPHPLYTPTPRRRRRRNKSRSLASSRTGRSSRSGRSARSRVKSAWRTVRRRKRRRRTRSIGGKSFTSGSSSSSSSSSSSTSSSGTTGSSTGSSGSTRSSSTWAGWRFWRNSSSGSSTSSSSSGSDSGWDPPVPHFTLLTPHLTRPHFAYPPHLFPGANRSLPNTPGTTPFGAPVFDILNSATLEPALDRLQQFWQERRQVDGVGGDLGASAAPLNDDGDYFGPAEPSLAQASGVSTPEVSTPLDPPHHRMLKGERKAAMAEEKRFGGLKAHENGPAWWLDVMCPSVADMREIRKHLPLHPLTMEDILHQETREKIESFPTLGYYFIIFRALDESYFKYTSPENSQTDFADLLAGQAERGRRGSLDSHVPGASTGLRGRVDIVEGVGGKEGVEGVGVGAVNVYLCVFSDGIISFHFEDFSKHHDRVQGKLQTFGLSKSMSSHWIAYGLMDSMVDAFFPIIDFIEAEANEVDAYLADPLGHGTTVTNAAGVVQVPAPDVVGISVNGIQDVEKEKESSPSHSSVSVQRATIRRIATVQALRWAPKLKIPKPVLRAFPRSWVTTTTRQYETSMLIDSSEHHFYLSSGLADQEAIPAVRGEDSGAFIGDTKFDRGVMLVRITDMRKLVTGLSRLLGPKVDVVRGLRKRTLESNLGLIRSDDAKQDIAIYLGDLYDHIIAMQQSLNFFDVILSHDHPAYLSMLHLTLTSAKGTISMSVVKLTIVTLTILPIQIFTGLFSLNAEVPHQGNRDLVKPNGEPVGLAVWGAILAGTLGVASFMWFLIWLVFRSSRRQFRKRGTGLKAE
ncbi:hypothetical protein OIV83_004335 [Microbotryomycetes sp. JL201]|nr:hypothetical protein OIV83_004290 [Microbotryomycetes sp. JL201]KAK4049187.1 hypothetical protein OIV83_004335 [Microbotryomycetes sp. JL201]